MVVAVLGMVMVSEVSSLAATPSKHLYKNCGQLRQNFYPDGYFGVARGWAVVGSSMAVVNRKVYIANIRLDFDGDGIICERENIQNPPTTTTTTTTTPSTPVPNLANFVGQYGKSVVTVYCGNSQGSGVSIPVTIGADGAAQGMQSYVVTNHHVVKNCLVGDWLSRRVTLRVQGVEYVGYVWSWKTEAQGKDLAAIYTTAVIPRVLSVFNVKLPQLGDVAVAIGSTGGIAGTATQGAIAGLSDNYILTTAQAGFGASGGALFNKSGQLLGIITGDIGLLLRVIPVTRFCDTPYGAAGCSITWIGAIASPVVTVPSTTTIASPVVTVPSTTTTTIASPVVHGQIFGRPYLSGAYWLIGNIENAPGFTGIQAYINGAWVGVSYSTRQESCAGCGTSALVLDTFGFNVLFRHIKETWNGTAYVITDIWPRSASSGY